MKKFFIIIVKSGKVSVLEILQKKELKMEEVKPGIDLKPISHDDMYEQPPQFPFRNFKRYVDDEFPSIDACKKHLHSKDIYDFDCITFNGTFRDSSLNFILRSLD